MSHQKVAQSSKRCSTHKPFFQPKTDSSLLLEPGRDEFFPDISCLDIHNEIESLALEKPRREIGSIDGEVRDGARYETASRGGGGSGLRGDG